MAVTERTTLHGRPMQGPTTGRPDNAYGGMTYYDETAGVQMYWDSEREEYRPMGVAAATDTTNIPAPALAIPGLVFAADTGELLISDGAAQLRPAEEPESSSSSPSSGE